MSLIHNIVDCLHLFSSALPIGSFAFSQGLESAVSNGLVHDESSFSEWLNAILMGNYRTLDLRAARCIYRSDSEEKKFSFNQTLLASRATQELFCEDILLGKALRNWAKKNSISVSNFESVSLITIYSDICRAWDISEEIFVAGFSWAWLENQVMVAAKTIPMGQSKLQSILIDTKPILYEALKDSRLNSNRSWTSSTPGLALLSGMHEIQYSRLFRS